MAEYLLYHDEKHVGLLVHRACLVRNSRLHSGAAVKPADGVAVLLCVPLGPPGLVCWVMLGPACGQRGQGNEYKGLHLVARTVVLSVEKFGKI